MTIFNSAYDTTAGKGFVTHKILQALKEAVIRDNVEQSNSFDLPQTEGVKTFFIVNKRVSESNVPYFTHPFIFGMNDVRKEDNVKYIATDIRPYASYNKNHVEDSDALSIRNKMEFDLATIRTTLNLIWLNERPELLRDISVVPVAIFSSWISESVSKRFALDPKDQMVLTIITAIFYYTLFNKSDKFDDEEIVRITSAVMRATRAPAKEVVAVFDRIQGLSNISDYCKNVRDLLENPRLQDFNEGLLISIVGNAWFGTNAKEMLAVALEHPPTWLAITYMSFVERSYKNSSIAKISQRFAQNKGETEFVKSLISLVKNYD